MMKKETFYSFILAFIISLTYSASAQKAADKGKNSCTITEQYIVVRIDKKSSYDELKTFLNDMDMSALNLDSVYFHNSLGALAAEGWKLTRVSEHVVDIYKITDNSLENKAKGPYKSYFDLEKMADKEAPSVDEFTKVGINSFKKRANITELENGFTRFFLSENLDADRIYLSGSFNKWSTMATPMTKTDKGWEALIKLSPGKHLYKFIVDGFWQTDKNNMIFAIDEGNKNSVYYKYNTKFELKGFSNAKKIYLVGNFNGWKVHKKSPYQLSKTQNGWEIDLFMKEGTYPYKYVVDGKWITDPDNPISRFDGRSQYNSLKIFGDTTFIRFYSNATYQRVTVAGDFNDWNFDELVMTKKQGYWELPYVFGEGNYLYKFKADNQYFIDEKNPLTSGYDEEINSVLVVNPNHTFTFKTAETKKEVIVTGTFFDWNSNGFRMLNKGDVWKIDLYIPRGKNLYKFIVDGEWIIDSENKYYEPNREGTNNSVLWKDALE